MGTMPVTITGPGARFSDLMLPSIKAHIKSNLQVRFDTMPELAIDEDEAALIYQGNVATSLADLHSNVIAMRKSQGNQ